MTTTEINLYRYTASEDDSFPEIIYKYTIPNMSNFSISYNTPVSPLPLPEENVNENILVKIEGNSGVIDIDWTITELPTGTHVLKRAYVGSKASSVPVADRGDGLLGSHAVGNGDTIKFDPLNHETAEEVMVFRDLEPSSGGSSSKPERQIDMLREFMENKSIDNDYLLTIHSVPDDASGYGTATQPMRFYGSPSTMSFSAGSGSPVVWSARLQFMIGNTVTVYDEDSPDKPEDLSVTAERKSGTSGTTTAHGFQVKCKEPINAGATEINKLGVLSRREGSPAWSKHEWTITTGNTGDEDTLKQDGDDYYVIHLPLVAEGAVVEEDDIPDLTAAGLFDYDAADFPTSDFFTDPATRYNIVVYFANTASVGRTARKTKLTLADV